MVGPILEKLNATELVARNQTIFQAIAQITYLFQSDSIIIYECIFV